MRRRQRFVRLVAALALVTSCAGTGPSGSGSSTGSLPNPFTVVATWSARSLGLEHVLAFAIGPDGNIYVTDASQQVAVISPDGKVLIRWGSLGSKPGQFRFVPGSPGYRFDIPARIAVSGDGRVYVIDPGNHRIQSFTLDGGFLDTVGGFGNDAGQFLAPGFLVVDHQGDLYVDDTATGKVTKYSPDGRYLWSIGGSGSEFFDLHLATVDAHDRIVAENEAGHGEIVYIDGSSHVVDSFQSHGCDATVDAAGNTYVNADVNGCDPGLTQVFDREHRLVAEWAGRDNPLGSPPRFTPDGQAFALSEDGALLKLAISLPGT